MQKSGKILEIPGGKLQGIELPWNPVKKRTRINHACSRKSKFGSRYSWRIICYTLIKECPKFHLANVLMVRNVRNKFYGVYCI